jgi:tetratricopeptide (TPR) repeat protein
LTKVLNKIVSKKGVKIMKKALGSLALFGLLATGCMVYAKTPIDECKIFNNAEDYKKAIEAGELAVQKYPGDPRAYLCLGEAYYNVGELKLAYEKLKRAESLANSKGDKEDLMYIYNQIGNVLGNMGHLDDALLYFNRSLNFAEDLGDASMKASVLNNKAIYDYKEGPMALDYCRRSLGLTTDEKRKARVYNTMGMIYIKYGNSNYKEAKDLFEKAIEIGDGDYHVISIAKLNLGDTYRRERDYKNAEKYLFEGLEGVKKVGDKYWIAKGYFYLGSFYEDKGDVKTAKEYYTRAYNLFKSIGAEGDAQYTLRKMS